MGITSYLQDRTLFHDPPVYFVEEEDIEYLRLQLHKDVDNLINAHKADTFCISQPRVDIIEEGFSGTNGEA